MMRGVRKFTLKQVIGIVCAVLAVAVGACIPRVVVAVSDYQLSHSATLISGLPAQISSAQKNTYLQALEIANKPHSTIALAKAPRMTSEDARVAAQELFKTVAEPTGVVQAQLVVTPVLATSRANPFDSAVLWECKWIYEDGKVCNASLDDSSGVVVAMSLPFDVENEKQALEALQAISPVDAAGVLGGEEQTNRGDVAGQTNQVDVAEVWFQIMCGRMISYLEITCPARIVSAETNAANGRTMTIELAQSGGDGLPEETAKLILEEKNSTFTLGL